MQTFSFMEMHLKMLFAEWQSFCSALNMNHYCLIYWLDSFSARWPWNEDYCLRPRCDDFCSLMTAEPYTVLFSERSLSLQLDNDDMALDRFLTRPPNHRGSLKHVGEVAMAYCNHCFKSAPCCIPFSVPLLPCRRVDRGLGVISIRKTVLPGMAIPMLKIRRPNGRLIFNMEIAIRR